MVKHNTLCFSISLCLYVPFLSCLQSLCIIYSFFVFFSLSFRLFSSTFSLFLYLSPFSLSLYLFYIFFYYLFCITFPFSLSLTCFLYLYPFSNSSFINSHSFSLSLSLFLFSSYVQLLSFSAPKSI